MDDYHDQEEDVSVSVCTCRADDKSSRTLQPQSIQPIMRFIPRSTSKKFSTLAPRLSCGPELVGNLVNRSTARRPASPHHVNMERILPKHHPNIVKQTTEVRESASKSSLREPQSMLYELHFFCISSPPLARP